MVIHGRTGFWASTPREWADGDQPAGRRPRAAAADGGGGPAVGGEGVRRRRLGAADGGRDRRRCPGCPALPLLRRRRGNAFRVCRFAGRQGGMIRTDVAFSGWFCSDFLLAAALPAARCVAEPSRAARTILGRSPTDCNPQRQRDPRGECLARRMAGRAEASCVGDWGCRPSANRSTSTCSTARRNSTSSSRRATRPSPTAGRFSSRAETELAIYAQEGDRLAEDLRHEMTHAYLHSALANIPPLWLDEGLAKYFEVPPGRHGLNRQYVRQIAEAMQKGAWHPNLRRLEQLDPAGDMSQEDYVESWAWIHYLLESQPPQADSAAAAPRRFAAEPRPGRFLHDAADGPGGASGMGAFGTRAAGGDGLRILDCQRSKMMHASQFGDGWRRSTPRSSV